MRRSRILLAALVVLAAVYAAQFVPRPRPTPAQRASAPTLVWQPTVVRGVALPPSGSSQRGRLTSDAPQTMLIPTEIPADSATLLQNFTPPAPIRLLSSDNGAADLLWVAQVAD